MTWSHIRLRDRTLDNVIARSTAWPHARCGHALTVVLWVVVAARLLQVWGKRAAASPSPVDEPA